MEKDFVYVFDFETAAELNQYVETTNGVFKCEDENGHDDLVSALYWSIFMLNSDYYISATDTDNELVKKPNKPMVFKSGFDEFGKQTKVLNAFIKNVRNENEQELLDYIRE